MRGSASRLVAVTGLLIFVGGCGGDDEVIQTPPEPLVQIAGDYETSYSELSDTCGIDLPPFDESGAKFFSTPGLGYFYTRIPWGSCDQYQTADTARTGNKVTSSLSYLDSRDNGCTIQHTATVEYNFTENAFTGTERHTFAYISGDCGGFNRCEWMVRIDASRCEQCEVGCSCCGPSLEWPVP